MFEHRKSENFHEDYSSSTSSTIKTKAQIGFNL